GAPALSLRAVARAVDMSPAGLYRYYDGRDALLTALLVDAYNDLADTVEEAMRGDGAYRQRILTGIDAYRSWAVADPNRFLLIFGTAIPGYAAPQDGPTVAANRRMGMAYFTVAAQAFSAGQLPTPLTDRAPTTAEVDVATQLSAVAPGFPPALVPVMLSTWAHWHGLVLLEVTGQLDWAYPDSRAFYDQQAAAIVDRMLGA
ncbi:MAG TPA: TetR-like C-terminal domain-containing protein, partial [Euzebya sp.]|nr:TetR-like C-terminal domain-containing protein [Euzebya sp.]